jgi:hypothetical protein
MTSSFLKYRVLGSRPLELLLEVSAELTAPESLDESTLLVSRSRFHCIASSTIPRPYVLWSISVLLLSIASRGRWSAPSLTISIKSRDWNSAHTVSYIGIWSHLTKSASTKTLTGGTYESHLLILQLSHSRYRGYLHAV